MMNQPIQGGGTGIPHLPRMIEVNGVFTPEAPTDFVSAGVSAEVLADLVLKSTYTVPQCTSEWVAGQIKLPMPLVESLLQQLKTDQMLQVLGQVGPYNHRYAITEKGRERSKWLLEISGYVGPAPVSLESYTAMIDWQLAQYPQITLELVQKALASLVLPDTDVYTSALAVMSQRSLFLSGPPGNGKTSVARALHNAIVGDLWIPHCIGVGSEIIRIYDQQCHELAEFSAPQLWKVDQRWMRVKRPLIVAGGEMTIESLDLSYSKAMRFYEAPLHFKSNGGTFVIDDFGRQRVDPTELLNRWIIPLENRIDYLTLHTGLKIMVPFRQMLVVATNLDPNKVMDPAFLRRMGYRVYVGAPTRDRFCEIFTRYAARYNMQVPPGLLERLLHRYLKEERELRGCEPRDLVERVRDICKLRRVPMQLTDENLNLAWCGYFGVSSSR